MIQIYYFIKSLFIGRQSEGIVSEIKKPKEVMTYIVILWALYVIFFKNQYRFVNYFFLAFTLITYGWKRYTDGDWKYWYKLHEGWDYKNRKV